MNVRGKPNTLASLARTIKANNRKATQNALSAGRALREGQQLLASHGNGIFGRWVESDCEMNKRTAYRLIALWNAFGNCDNVTRLADLEALRLLLKSDVAIDQARRLLKQSRRIDLATAKKIMAKLQPERSEKRTPTVIQTPVGSVSILPNDGQSIDDVLTAAVRELKRPLVA